jgi:hypothetical protein
MHIRYPIFPMSTTFHTYVKQYQVIRPERLYGNFRNYTETGFTTDDASIYFIAKCMAVEWLPETFVIGDNYNLSGRIRVDGKDHEVSLDMGAYWFAMPQIQEHFSAKEHMCEYFMARSITTTGLSVPNAVKYKRGTSINFAASDSEKLTVECELSRHMNSEGHAQTEIYAYQAINFFDLPGPKLDIIYIGSSVSNAFKRLYKHDKWGRMQAEKKRNEDLLVYFAALEGDAFQHESVDGLSLIARDDHGVSAEDETLITEMALINYFKPHYNSLHKERDISTSERVERALKDEGFNEVTVELILEGPLGALGSPHIKAHGSHTAMHKIA